MWNRVGRQGGVSGRDGDGLLRRVGVVARRALAVLLLGLCSPAFAAEPDATSHRWSIFQNNEAVGHLLAEQHGNTVDIEYFVDQNGRGPKHRERVVFGDGGLPVEWTIKGTSLMGGEVNERFRFGNGTATWVSQADSGEMPLDKPLPYIVNDGSPWASGFYAGYLASLPGRETKILPSGSMRLEVLDPVSIQREDGQLELRPRQVVGAYLDPGFVFVDGAGAMVAIVSGGSIVLLDEYRDIHDELKVAAKNLQARRLAALQKSLAHGGGRQIDIENVRLFDPASGEVGPPSTVSIRGERIAGIRPFEAGAEAPAGERLVVQGDGGVLIPGLHDMHSHSTAVSGLYYLAAGVTSTRDMGNDNKQLEKLVSQIQRGQLAGPRITRAGFIEGSSPYSARNGILADSQEEALAAVDWYADRGFFQIKLYNSFNPDWVAAVAKRAHDRGLKVTGHIPAFSSPDRNIREGYDEIAHINQLMLGWLLEEGEDTRTPLRLTAMQRAADLDLHSDTVRATIELMQDRGIAMDTTAVILERLMMSRAGTVIEADEPFLSRMPIGYQRYRKRTYVPLESREEDARYARAFQRILETIDLLYESGITLLPGTDDTTGFTVHRELELYHRAGIDAADVLRMATLDAASYLGRASDLGTIEVGKLADVVLLADDPTQDISAVRRPRMVVKGGALYLPGEIYHSLGIAPFAGPPAMEVTSGR